MSDLDENLVPEPATDVDPRSLDIEPTAEEFFILSRLNGSTSIGQLCKTSGLGPKKTLECVENLREYGLLRLPGDERSGGAPSTAEDASEPSTSSATASSQPDAPSTPEQTTDSDSSDNTSASVGARGDLGKALRSRFPISFSDFEFDAQLLDQSIEIEDDFKREILFVHEQLDDLNYYELLGLDADAGRRDLRRAYFPLSKRYHPDRFYKKILGDFEPMIRRIFQRITTAYQTLSDRNKREEYDTSLRQGRDTHATPQMASTPASRRSEPREEIQGDRKRSMAYKVLVQRGDQAMSDGRIPAALREYRKALTLQRNVELPLRISRKLLDTGEYLEDATSFAQTARNIDSSSPKALKLIGEIYERKDELDDALYHYEMALEAAPDDDELQQRIDRLRD